MVRFVKRTVAQHGEAEKAQLQLVIKAVSAEAALPSQRDLDARELADIEAGRRAITTEAMRCTECHEFRRPDENDTAPLLTGYGSRKWLIDFIADPAHPQFYGRRNDRMPAYRASGILTEAEMGILADWLRGDWYEAGPQGAP